jgi:hypothetical protein
MLIANTILYGSPEDQLHSAIKNDISFALPNE